MVKTAQTCGRKKKQGCQQEYDKGFDQNKAIVVQNKTRLAVFLVQWRM